MDDTAHPHRGNGRRPGPTAPAGKGADGPAADDAPSFPAPPDATLPEPPAQGLPPPGTEVPLQDGALLRQFRHRERIVQGGLFGTMWRLALPTTATVVLQDVFNLVDLFWVGSLGKTAVAAVATSGVLLGLAFMLALGISSGAMAMVARYVGMRRDSTHIVAQAGIMAAGIAVVVALSGWVFAEDMLRLLRAEESVISVGAAYVRISALGTLVVYVGLVLQTALRSSGDAMTPLIVMAIANLINIELDPILIFGMFGAPRLGVTGSAWATLVSQTVALLLVVYLLFLSEHTHYRLRVHHLRPDGAVMGRIVKIGVFSAAQGIVRNLSAVALLRIVAVFGTAILAAYGIGMRVWFAVLMPSQGFGIAAATMVGQNLGAGRPDRAARSGWLASCTFGAISLALSVLFVALPEEIVRIFNSDPDVVASGTHFLLYIGATLTFTGFSIVLGRAMNGAGDTLSPLVITALVFLVVRIPLAHVMASWTGEAYGVWLAIAATNVLHGVVMVGWFAAGHWKHRRV